MQALDLLFFVSLAGVGIYCIWLGIAMGRWRELKDNGLLYPNGTNPRDCLDPEGFLAFMRPRMVIFGLVSLVAGGGLGLNALLKLNHTGLLVGSILLALGDVFFYAMTINGSYKRFFKP